MATDLERCDWLLEAVSHLGVPCEASVSIFYKVMLGPLTILLITGVSCLVANHRITGDNTMFIGSGWDRRPKPAQLMVVVWTLYMFFRLLHAILLLTDAAVNHLWVIGVLNELIFLSATNGTVYFVAGLVHTIPASYAKGEGTPNKKGGSSNSDALRVYLPAPSQINKIFLFNSILPLFTSIPWAVIAAMARQRNDEATFKTARNGEMFTWVCHIFYLAIVNGYFGWKIRQISAQSSQMNAEGQALFKTINGHFKSLWGTTIFTSGGFFILGEFLEGLRLRQDTMGAVLYMLIQVWFQTQSLPMMIFAFKTYADTLLKKRRRLTNPRNPLSSNPNASHITSNQIASNQVTSVSQAALIRKV